MKFQTAVRLATNHLLRSDRARTAKGQTIEFEQDIYGNLEAQTWGWDYACIRVPTERSQMIARKCRLQMRENQDAFDEIELRYIFDILRRESR
jgi:hypothetical protein